MIFDSCSNILTNTRISEPFSLARRRANGSCCFHFHCIIFVLMLSVQYVLLQNNNEILAWEENKLLQENLKNIILPTKHFLKIPINSDTEVNVQLQIPSTIDQSGERKYPLLVYV